MRNDARPVGEEFRDIAEHHPQGNGADREAASEERPGDDRNPSNSGSNPANRPPPDASER